MVSALVVSGLSWNQSQILYVEILRSVYLKGTTVAELWTNYAALGIFAIIFNTLAALTYKKQA